MALNYYLKTRCFCLNCMCKEVHRFLLMHTLYNSSLETYILLFDNAAPDSSCAKRSSHLLKYPRLVSTTLRFHIPATIWGTYNERTLINNIIRGNAWQQALAFYNRLLCVTVPGRSKCVHFGQPCSVLRYIGISCLLLHVR